MEKSLRDTAKRLQITPAHLSDLENGRRTPSEELLLRIRDVYGVEEAILRARWGRAETVVDEVATKTPTTAAKAPELLRAASDLSADQWDDLIRRAKALAKRTKPTSTHRKI
ncbi:MAG: helix-turn-helix transcriptional regulator [Phycisphaeraceae bacterium]|nr:helix-turn-helix transcriptional regulator [Phycisphaerales bacterium]MCB9842351.1 helix-turn-helix transcriptional regulator [Phycisphaeraceae bacterium]